MKRAIAELKGSPTPPANPLVQGGTPGDTMRSVSQVLHCLQAVDLDDEITEEQASGLRLILQTCTDALDFERERARADW